MMKTRWDTIAPSPYPWERRALDFVRAGLPDHEPYRAWANFEFLAGDGALYEVDLLVRKAAPSEGDSTRLQGEGEVVRRVRSESIVALCEVSLARFFLD